MSRIYIARLAPWSRQDVLARAGPTNVHDAKHRLSMSAAHKVRQDHCWYVHPISSRAHTKFYPDQIKRHAQQASKHTYTVLIVPRVSTLVTRILEEEGVLGDVTLASYNLQFIPVAEDVLSLEHDLAFKEIWVVLTPFTLPHCSH